VDEVADDVYGHLPLVRLGGDGLDLSVVAVHQRDPGAAMAWVAPLGLVEPGGYHRGDVIGERGGQPLAGRGRAGLAGAAALPGRGDDVGGRPRHRDGVVDGGQLGHPLAAVFLPW
jgi:8-oxo-dGTP pyrophosphatase MutT (NUDIX family)